MVAPPDTLSQMSSVSSSRAHHLITISHPLSFAPVIEWRPPCRRIFFVAQLRRAIVKARNARLLQMNTESPDMAEMNARLYDENTRRLVIYYRRLKMQMRQEAYEQQMREAPWNREAIRREMREGYWRHW